MPHSHASCFRITCYKTGSYALMHFMVAITVAYLLTQSWRAALAIGLVEPLVQTVAFYFHDRAWSKHDKGQAASPSESVELRRPS
ncbi:DUF2061 domain-containing protein [Erythrobacter arachoides]|uniref:DUF2061 domain-containing protein n=1 Tax=Aurantiacibacter arachoides TaxID=1850444 RepID=A0A844ZVS9_9SPHN|nr:DUF2061 domain-containing protein [Aurantiacibacter arachoides]MXO92163.1 DUF2061 domain-containing protein [Aurantiacibacter arachoides]GGD59199.1 hypothetical protein GCM10011411_19270 [Aurantiacibacter arachoides]